MIRMSQEMFLMRIMRVIRKVIIEAEKFCAHRSKPVQEYVNILSLKHEENIYTSKFFYSSEKERMRAKC